MLLKVTDATEFEALWEALTQYVENNEDCDPKVWTPALSARTAAARKFLDAFNAAAEAAARAAS